MTEGSDPYVKTQHHLTLATAEAALAGAVAHAESLGVAAVIVVTDAAGDSLPVDPTTMDVDLPVLASRDTLLLRLLGEVQAADPALFARVSEVQRTSRGDVILVLPELRILANASVSATRLADLLPVELDLARRKWRANELDVRYRDQVIARLTTR